MQSQQILWKLNQEIEEYLRSDARVIERERAARRIQLTISGLVRHLRVVGEVWLFGSFSYGFKTGGSDLDIVLATSTEAPQSILSKFAQHAGNYGLVNVTKIFQAAVPILKLTDLKSNMEVDFCINNALGVRNSLLLRAYCEYDARVLQLGKLVKDWAKMHELVGTADGYLSSYAYMLLTVFYLQSVTPPVVPNLQEFASPSVPILDNKWGLERVWETKFENDVRSIPPSRNVQSVGGLLIGFFRFYAEVFDWQWCAISIRLNQLGHPINKFSLVISAQEDQWCIEDPFDLKHNLAGKCTRAARSEIMEAMRTCCTTLTRTGSWDQARPATPASFYLKFRVYHNTAPETLLEEFEHFDVIKLYCPNLSSGQHGNAFLEFASTTHRRRAQAKNENYVGDCQLHLHCSSQAALNALLGQSPYSTYEMASYRKWKMSLLARYMMPSELVKPIVTPSQVEPIVTPERALWQPTHRPSGADASSISGKQSNSQSLQARALPLVAATPQADGSYFMPMDRNGPLGNYSQIQIQQPTVTGACTQPMIGNRGPVSSAVSSADGSSVLTTSNDKTARFWSTVTGACTLTLVGHNGRSNNSAVFSADESSVLTSSDDKTAKIWSTATGECTQTFIGHTDWVNSAVFSADGSSVLTGSADQTAKIWSIATGECTQTFVGHKGRINEAVFSADGSLVLTGSDDRWAKIWSTVTGECTRTLRGHDNWICSVVFSADGSSVLTASKDKTAKIWSTATGKCTQTLRGHGDRVNSVAFSADESLVITGASDNTAKIWCTVTGACTQTLVGCTGRINSAVFSVDGSSVLTGSNDKTAKIWSTATGECTQTLVGHKGRVNTAMFSADESSVLTGSGDNTTKIWSSTTSSGTQILVDPERVHKHWLAKGAGFSLQMEARRS